MSRFCAAALVGLLSGAPAAFSQSEQQAPASRVFLMNRAANRLHLGDGSVVEVVGSVDVGKAATYESAFIRIGGDVFTITASTAKCDRTELRVSSGKTELLMRADVGFAEEKLPVPIVMTIGDQSYHLFWGEGVFSPGPKRRAAEAVRKLPARFVLALRQLWSLADQLEDGVPARLLCLESVFEESVGPVLVVEKTPLNEKEVENLTRDAGVRRGP